MEAVGAQSGALPQGEVGLSAALAAASAPRAGDATASLVAGGAAEAQGAESDAPANAGAANEPRRAPVVHTPVDAEKALGNHGTETHRDQPIAADEGERPEQAPAEAGQPTISERRARASRTIERLVEASDIVRHAAEGGRASGGTEQGAASAGAATASIVRADGPATIEGETRTQAPPAAEDGGDGTDPEAAARARARATAAPGEPRRTSREQADSKDANAPGHAPLARPTSEAGAHSGAVHGLPAVQPATGHVAAPSIGAPAARATETPEELNASVSRGLSAAVNQKGGAITLRLQPEHLGALRIQLDIADGVVRARFEAGAVQAVEMLNRSMDALRSALESRGLSVERVSVELAPGGAGSASQQPGTGQQGMGERESAARGFQHDAADGRSRGWADDRGRQQGGREQGWNGERNAEDGGDGALHAPVFERWLRLGVDRTA